MSAEGRLDRVYPALTAKERALLLLRYYREDIDEDPAIRSTMPSTQVWEFNRLLRLISAVNTEIAYLLMLLKARATQVDLKYAWLMTLMLWAMEADGVRERLLCKTKDRKERQSIRKLFPRSPGGLSVPIDTLTSHEQEPTLSAGDEIVRALVIGIKQGLEQHWQELRSVEIAVAEVADEEFGGEELFRTETRMLLDDAKKMLLKVHNGLLSYVEPFELSEPDAADLEIARKLIAKAAE